MIFGINHAKARTSRPSKALFPRSRSTTPIKLNVFIKNGHFVAFSNNNYFMNRPNPIDFKVHGSTKFFYLRRRLSHKKFTFTIFTIFTNRLIIQPESSVDVYIFNKVNWEAGV